MPAGIPGDSAANNTGANPSAGLPATFDLLSGPKGSPFDKDPAGKASTGALSTGIGYGPTTLFAPIPPINAGGSGAFNGGPAQPTPKYIYHYIVGQSTPNPGAAAPDSRYMYIGGGRSSATGATFGRPFPPNPYTAGYGIGAAGNGGARDAGAGPAFTGFLMQSVAGNVIAPGAAIEAGWLNRSGATVPNQGGAFGVSNAASAAVA
jgi:hypothetical protein